MSTFLPKEKTNAHIEGVVSSIQERAKSPELLAAFHRGHDFEALLEKMPDLRSQIAKSSSREVTLAFGGGMLDPEGDGVGEPPFGNFWARLVWTGILGVSGFLVAAAIYMSFVLPAVKAFIALLPFLGIGAIVLAALLTVLYQIRSMRKRK